ncbi:50S ribosomal protein L1 [Pyrobaculum sp. 3827-6]|uniref:50S ribosomal protein L1 n=1 Tax=Pyrobaculum sp. 3827-6 TaxID=2983604 RepID=UPI0021D7E712|nr:50S ribosomal protein L1 [Pyrobaculum sp. 3827-6]MCU7787323.1 50S ribosomal protein L1 [Pyrobaculum sp. 3827-6]
MSAVINKEALLAKIAEALKRGRQRRFKQSVELIVVLRGVDLSKPENRINLLVELPHPPKPNKIAAFAHGAFEVNARNAGVDAVITRDQVEGLSGNKRAIRKLAKQYDFFIAPPDLMPLLGRVVGPIFGPRGKMPEVVPPNIEVKAVVERLKRAVRVRLRNEPVIKVRIGSEAQDPKEILDNALAVLEEVNRRFPLRQYLDDIYIKKTMGPPVKIRAAEALVK